MDKWVEQGIHTIEFCVGLISNTASYLRLWAVNLAHSTLTEIIHKNTIGKKTILIKIVTSPIYFISLFALLLGLECLSAVLHSLRLNWIEFGNKFVKGGGIQFEPLSNEIDDE